jgi:hypothetical protein
MNALFSECTDEKNGRKEALAALEAKIEAKTDKAEFSSLIKNFGGSQVSTLTDMRTEYTMKYTDLQ